MRIIGLFGVAIISFGATQSALASDSYIQAETVLTNYVFWSAVLVGALAVFMVFANAHKMKGGLFGTVLSLFGTGMLIVLVSYMLGSEALQLIGKMQHVSDVLLILGFVTMALAASRLSSITNVK